MRLHLHLLTLALATSLASAQVRAGPRPSTTPSSATGAVQAPRATPAAIVDVPAGHWARAGVTLLIQKGLILGYPDGTYRGNQAITRYQAALIFARLLRQGVLQLPGVQAQLTPADLQVLARAVGELATQITTLGTRLSDVVSDIDAVKDRLGTVEGTLQQVVQVAATHAEVDAVSAQAATKTGVSALAARVAALEAESAATRTSSQSAQPTPGPPKPGELPNVAFRQDAPARFAVGGGVTKTPRASLGFGVMVSMRNVVGEFGLQAAGSYNGSARQYSMQVNVTRPLGRADALIQPYLGLGSGVLVSPNRRAGTVGVSDPFVSVLGGASYAFTDTLRLYAEVDGRYYHSNRGSGTGLAARSNKGVGAEVHMGAKLAF